MVGRDRAVELPGRDHPQQARPGPGHGQHVRAQAGARHAVERHPPRPAHRRADRHPAGRRQHRRVAATTSSARCSPPRPTSTWSPSPARPPPAGGSWRPPPATLKPVFLELGGKSVNLVLDDADFPAPMPWPASSVCIHAGQGCAMPTRLLVPRSRYDEAVELAAAGLRRGHLRRPDRRRQPHGPAGLDAPAGAGARLHREGQGGGRSARVRRRRARRTCPRAGSSSRRCSPTSTTR